jgi:hypothetical protein
MSVARAPVPQLCRSGHERLSTEKPETRPLSTGDATTTGLPTKVTEARSGDNFGVR